MHAAAGILTTRGGMTSHAAVVARGMGKTCVVGAGEITVDEATASRSARRASRPARATGSRSTGRRARSSSARSPTRPSEVLQVALEKSARRRRRRPIYRAFERILVVGRQAPAPRRPRQRRHADRRDAWPSCSAPRASASAARSTCSSRRRRILAVREMILAESAEGRRKALAKILPDAARRTSSGIFREMGPRPVTIRLLDPPLHEFLPERGRARSRRTAAELEGPARAAARARAAAPRDEPDARPPRLPARASRTRRSTRCRSARSSRPRPRSQRAGGQP